MNTEDINTHFDGLVVEANAEYRKEFLLFTNQGRLFKWYNKKKITSFLSNKQINWASELVLNQNERPIYGVGTSDYSGYMVFAFANGKVSKIDMKAFETKQERSCLINAYSLGSTLIFIKHIPNDLDLIIYSSSKKILVFNTEIINSLSTKYAAGVQILKLRSPSIAVGVKLLRDVTIQDLSYYKRNQAAIGYYLKPGDRVY